MPLEGSKGVHTILALITILADNLILQPVSRRLSMHRILRWFGLGSPIEHDEDTHLVIRSGARIFFFCIMARTDTGLTLFWFVVTISSRCVAVTGEIKKCQVLPRKVLQTVGAGFDAIKVRMLSPSQSRAHSQHNLS